MKFKSRMRTGMSMGRRPRDLSGQKFGLLTAVYPTERRDHRGSVYWHCVCECGNEIDVAAGALLDGNTRSRSHREDILSMELVWKFWRRERSEETTKVFSEVSFI